MFEASNEERKAGLLNVSCVITRIWNLPPKLMCWEICPNTGKFKGESWEVADYEGSFPGIANLLEILMIQTAHCGIGSPEVNHHRWCHRFTITAWPLQWIDHWWFWILMCYWKVVEMEGMASLENVAPCEHGLEGYILPTPLSHILALLGWHKMSSVTIMMFCRAMGSKCRNHR